MRYLKQADSLETKDKPEVTNGRPRKEKPRKGQHGQVEEQSDTRDGNILPAAISRPQQRAIRRRTQTVIHIRSNNQSLPHRRQDPVELVSGAIAYFTQSEWTSVQQQALDAWQTWWSARDGPHAGRKPVEDVIRIFSNLLFLGRLTGVRFRWHAALYKESHIYGYTEPIRKGYVRIELDPEDHSKANGVCSHKEDLVSTLLHECIHAYLILHSCNGLCKFRDCKDAMGSGGHGRAWFRLSSKLQAVARQELQIDLKIRIFSSMWKKRKRPEYVPTLEEWCEYKRHLESPSFISPDGKWIEKRFAKMWKRYFPDSELLEARADKGARNDIQQDIEKEIQGVKKLKIVTRES